MTAQPWAVLRARRLPLSLRVHRRVPPVLLLALLATLAAMVLNMSVGEYPVAPLDVVKSLLRIPTADANDSFVINTLRLPRMLVAALVGLALGVSGAILQGLTRNPLADPGVVGISGGAALVAVTLIVVVRDVPAILLPLGAFAGALAVAGAVYALAWRGGDSPLRLILIGVGLGAMATAGTTLMLTFGDVTDVQRALVWLTGSVYGRTWNEFWPLLPWVGLGLPLALALAPQLNALSLGEEVARGLGSRVARDRSALLLLAVALAGASVAAAGTVGFVGLLAPHLARRLVGPAHEGLLPTAGVFGALIVVCADLLGRTLLAPIELPCGLVTAVVGAPLLVVLLLRGRGGPR